MIEVAANWPSPWGEPRVHAPRPPRQAILAGLAIFGFVATVAIGAVAIAQMPAKTLRCDITLTSDDMIVANGHVVTMPQTPPITRTVVWQVKGDRYTALSMDGMDPATIVRQLNAEDADIQAQYGFKPIEGPKEAWLPLRVTDQSYILQDKSEPNDTAFLSVDRSTGDVSGSTSSKVNESTFKSRFTGHCMPVGGSIL